MLWALEGSYNGSFLCVGVSRMQVTGCLIVHSRIMELEYEIHYGEKKILNPYMALDAQSGYTTPARPGMRTPRPY